MKRVSAKSIGNLFETVFKNVSEAQGWTVLRIPDGCRRVSQFHIIPVKSPFDFIVARHGKVIFLDCKTYDDKVIPYAKINRNQLAWLRSMQLAGCSAGYVVYLRDLDWVVFFSALQLAEMKPRESLSDEHGIVLGNLNNFDLELVP